MQTGGAVQGANTIPKRRWPNALRALVVIALVAGTMLLVVWVVPLSTTGGTDAENATPAAGSAIIHDDAGNENLVRRWRPPSAVIHDDAGNVNR